MMVHVKSLGHMGVESAQWRGPVGIRWQRSRSICRRWAGISQQTSGGERTAVDLEDRDPLRDVAFNPDDPNHEDVPEGDLVQANRPAGITAHDVPTILQQHKYVHTLTERKTFETKAGDYLQSKSASTVASRRTPYRAGPPS